MLRAAETIQRTDTGRQRRGNEDSSFARAPVFVVADGMGGAQAGEVASQIAVEAFERGLPDEGSPEERLSVVVQRANRRIHELSRREADLAGMGTTVTAAYLDGDQVAIAHVGDSRAYLFRDGRLKRLTQDHSLVEELIVRGRLTEEEALEHPQRSVITRALGVETTVEVDTWTYPVRPGDVVMLCSDGLTSMLSEQQVLDVLAGASDLREAGDRLIDGANAAGGRDNITVVLFRVEEVGASPIDQSTAIAPAGAAHSTTPRRQVASTPPAASPKTARKRARRSRTQGLDSPARPAGERHFGALGKTVAALTATLIVVFLIGAGGYIASRQLYFLGTNSQGLVTVYRGFPFVLPLGIPMYETYYVSGVPASTIPPDRRSTLLSHDMRSQGSATSLINALERGEISR